MKRSKMNRRKHERRPRTKLINKLGVPFRGPRLDMFQHIRKEHDRLVHLTRAQIKKLGPRELVRLWAALAEARELVRAQYWLEANAGVSMKYLSSAERKRRQAASA